MRLPVPLGSWRRTKTKRVGERKNEGGLVLSPPPPLFRSSPTTESLEQAIYEAMMIVDDDS